VTDEVVVAFAGTGAGTGELTWAQRGLWRAMQLTGSSMPLGGVTPPLPPGTTVEDMARVLAFAMSRHPALRTRMRTGAGPLPEQDVAADGEAALTVVEAGADDPAEVAEALRARWEGTVFDYAAEWPVRMGVVTAGGEARHLVAVYCHLALDLHGLELLIGDLSTMDLRTGRSDAPPPGTTPLALARRQAGPAAQRQSTASLRHWEHVLRAIPSRRLPGSSVRREPRWPELGYSSVAALHALRILVARTGLNTGPLLLAACAVGLTRVTRTDPAVLQVLVNNRFRPGLADAVTPLTQSSLVCVPVGGDPLAEVAARAQRETVRAAKNAYYDPLRLDELYETVDVERHEDVDVDCFFNDRRRAARHDEFDVVPTAADVRDALERSTPRLDRELERFDHRLFVHVNDVPDALDWTVCADSHHLAASDAEALLVAMEGALVEAALND
jgi:hypothetical protein